MSKSVHTTRSDYRKARDEDFGSKQAKDDVLATIRENLDAKAALKRTARGRPVPRKPDVSPRTKKKVRRAEEEPRPTKVLPVVRLEEFDRGRR